jgi:hypothetical protein
VLEGVGIGACCFWDPLKISSMVASCELVVCSTLGSVRALNICVSWQGGQIEVRLAQQCEWHICCPWIK